MLQDNLLHLDKTSRQFVMINFRDYGFILHLSMSSHQKLLAFPHKKYLEKLKYSVNIFKKCKFSTPKQD